MAWDPAAWGGVDSIVMSQSQTWVPNINVFELHSLALLGDQSVTVYPSGECSYFSQVIRLFDQLACFTIVRDDMSF